MVLPEFIIRSCMLFHVSTILQCQCQGQREVVQYKLLQLLLVYNKCHTKTFPYTDDDAVTDIDHLTVEEQTNEK